MARDVSIAISVKDNFSSAIATMRNANQAFNKDLSGLQSKLDTLNKTKATLQVDIKPLKKVLSEAEKQFNKTGDAADKLKFEMAHADYENAKRNLKLVSDYARQAEKDMLKLTDAASKAENRANRIQSSSVEGSIGRLATSGAVGLVGNVLSDITTTWVESAFGSNAGAMASSILSTGSMGAAIGSAIAPGIGTAIGAMGGAVLGAIQGQIAKFEKEDDVFKDYYQNLYSTVLEEQEQTLQKGIDIASKRETDRISFETLLGGEAADEYLKSLVQFGMDTPFEYDNLVDVSRVLLAYGYQQDELLPLLENVGNAGSALNMSLEDMKFVATALGRMRVTGKTTMEYLNPLLERGIDVWTYLAEASGKTKKEVQEMVSKGLVPGEEAAKAIADYMGYNFAGNMEKQSQTYAGLISTLDDVKTELENSMGEGYSAIRKIGLENEIGFLEGSHGDSLRDAYNKIGQWKAYQENQAEQYYRDVMNSIMSGRLSSNLYASEQKSAIERLMEEYKDAEKQYEMYKLYDEEQAIKAGAEMGRILAEAQAIATNEYNASEGAQLALETNRALAENIKNDSATQEAYWDAGYVMGQQFTKGLASATAITRDTLRAEAEALWEEAVNDETHTPTQRQLIKSNKGRFIADYVNSKSHAYGISYVPYDNYFAVLHEGERVLTASENRSYGQGSPNIYITGNEFIIRNESDISEVAKEIANLFNKAYLLAQ